MRKKYKKNSALGVLAHALHIGPKHRGRSITDLWDRLSRPGRSHPLNDSHRFHEESIMKIKELFVAIILASAVSIAHASPVQWTLDATQTSYSYKQAYGVFTYDADANLYSNVALRFTGDGNVYNINAGDAYGFNYGTSNGSGIYTFVFDTALTDAGGVVNGIATENDNDSTHPFTVRAAVLASPAATVPEPAQSALLFMGGMLMWIARRRGPPRRAAVH